MTSKDRPRQNKKKHCRTVQTFKICETRIFAKDTPPPPELFCLQFLWFCDQKFEWRARNQFFLRLFFQFAFTNKTNAPNANFHAYK